MKTHQAIARGFLTVAMMIASPAKAQTDHQHHGITPNDAVATHPAAASYAGQQQREIKALSAQEQQEWLEGKGLGLAKAAELNGYPGPMHALEHADSLKLSREQREKTKQLLNSHKATVRLLGKQLVDAERTLDVAFAQKAVTAAQINDMTAGIARIQGRIRAEHLATHLEQTAMLSAAQIAQYNVLRGYAN